MPLTSGITAGDLRKLIAGRPDKWKVPISVAYGPDVVDGVFVRLDGASTTRPKDPNMHMRTSRALFFTVSIVDGEEEE